MPDRAEKMAAKLVVVRPYLPEDGTWWVCFAGVRVEPPITGEANLYRSRDDAEYDAAIYRRAIASALREITTHAVEDALRAAIVDVGDGERPVSEEREEVIRQGTHIWSTTNVRDLLALLDYERQRAADLQAKLLHAITDNGYMEGVEAGRAMAACT